MRRNPIAYSRLFPLIAASVVCAVCATPVAVRTLSAELVRTQRVYAVSLHAYFGSVEKFAEAQVKVAEIRIDEITAEINRDFAQRANSALAGAATPVERQKIIDQLIRDIGNNANADQPLKQKIEESMASLKQKDAELEAAYHAILEASEKLDEYIQLKKTNQMLIDQLVQSVSINSQKINSIVDAITKIATDLSLTISKARS